MRVTAGTAKGTHLRAPAAGVRPTSDRVKEALFNALAPRLADARVLDLFAGTGALGIEALSRGAARAVFIERDARAAAAIRRNLVAAHLEAQGEVRRGTVPAALGGLERDGAAFDLIVLDPPYGQELPARTLQWLAASTLLAAGGVIAAEGHWRDDPGEVPGLRRLRDARYGETGLWFYAKQEAAEGRPEVLRQTGQEAAEGRPEVLRQTGGRWGAGMTKPDGVTALYPGSFDPVHNGHIDIIVRARRVFGRVVVAVATNVDKQAMFSTEDRVEMLRAAMAGQEGIEVRAFEGLTVEFAASIHAGVIVRGLRANEDFEFELKMAAMNKRLHPEIETVFMMTSPEYAYLSSTLIREVTGFGGSVAGLIPPAVEERLARLPKARRD